ncbi:LynF/TruF/PatF family peptide O-prenyltransferase [Coleofasciculus chthonoplastes]|uniref:LynF/TruF/PatF family peptide O-prenyltransferase n=1 Tax=Coleofasciculus TaxID=669368 RepID=UPI0032F55E5C
MTLNNLFKKINLQERRLQFIRSHQQAFDVEPTFPLPLFEETIVEIESSLSIILSCKVEGGRLLGGRFDMMPWQEENWPEFITPTFKFLDKIEAQLGVYLDRTLFEQFVAENIDSEKIRDSTIGIHLGSKLEDSSVTVVIHFNVDQDCEASARTVIALDGGHYPDELIQVLLKDMTTITFELFFDGHSYMDFGVGAPAQPGALGIRGNYLTPYIQNHFSQKVNHIFRGSFWLKICFSKVYKTPLLWFYFKNKNDILKYFRFNDLGDRIFNFYQSQSCTVLAAIVLTEQELEKSRLENFCFYYGKHDGCQLHPRL